MNHRWPHARMAIPPFRTSGTGGTVDLHPQAYGCRTGQANRAHMARAAAASNLRRHPDLAASLYAHCDRAPFGWEARNSAHPELASNPVHPEPVEGPRLAEGRQDG